MSELTVTKLDSALDGRLVSPGDDDFDAARMAWNLAADQHPAAVALVQSVDDVQAVMRFAAEHDFRVAPQSTGHGAKTLTGLEDAILLRTARLDGVEVDPSTRIARVGAGVQWRDVVDAASPRGLAGLHGSSGGVGVAGYTLGGGAGWLARRYGLASWSVTALDVVTADGELVRATAEEHPDLFWALRGGGGSFGVVTALEFELYPVTEAFAGGLWWPMERDAEVFSAWTEWVSALPDTVQSLARLLRMPDIPELPPNLRGRAFVVIEAACLVGESAAAELLRPLRALAPELDTLATIPAAQLSTIHGDPLDPVASAGEGMLLDGLPSAAIDALVGAAGAASGSSLISLEVRHLGGALARTDPRHGAQGAIEAPFALFAVGSADSPEAKVVTIASLEPVVRAFAPWRSERIVLTLADRLLDPEAAFGAPTARRLAQVKAEYDPTDRILANLPVGSPRAG